MSEPAEVTYEVRELHPGYFTYDVHVRPADGLAPIRQASGAFREEHRAELAATTAVGLIGMRLLAMGAAPLPVRRIGTTPRRRRVAHALGFGLACAAIGAVLGLVSSAVLWLVSAVW